MKIVMLTRGFIDDVEYQENILLRYYEKLGHEVHLITSTNVSLFDIVSDRHDKRAPERTYSLGTATIHRLRYTLNILGRIQRYPDITPILEKVRPDLIFAHNALLNMTDCVRHVRRHPNCKMILDFHGDFTNSGSSWLSLKIQHGIILKRVVDQARPYLSKIFPVTPESQKFLRTVYRVPDSEMEVLPLGADFDAARRVRASGARAALRANYKIAQDAIVVFTGGKLMPLRKTEALIAAFKRLPEAGIHLFVVGESPSVFSAYKQTLLNLADGSNNIHFAGWQNAEDVSRHFAMSDLAVFPAGQSILWQQAICMGLPLVIGDIAEGRQDVSYLNVHENIIVADQTKPLDDALHAVLEVLIRDAALRNKMAKGASKTAEEVLDWNLLVRRTLRFSNDADIDNNTRVDAVDIITRNPSIA